MRCRTTGFPIARICFRCIISTGVYSVDFESPIDGDVCLSTESIQLGSHYYITTDRLDDDKKTAEAQRYCITMYTVYHYDALNTYVHGLIQCTQYVRVREWHRCLIWTC